MKFTQIKRSDGDTLLCRNFVVDIWMDILQSIGNKVPTLCEHYYIVSKEKMLPFDQFSSDLRKIGVLGKKMKLSSS